METDQEKQKLQSQVRNDLVPIFQAELAALQTLASLMREEQQALESRDSYRLLEISAAKEPLLRSLQLATSQRFQAMQILGYTPGSDGMKSLLDWCHAGEALRQQSAQVQQLTEVCHELNVQNGMQINKNQEFVTRSLGILLGLGEEEFIGYNARGGRTEDGGNRTITTI